MKRSSAFLFALVSPVLSHCGSDSKPEVQIQEVTVEKIKEVQVPVEGQLKVVEKNGPCPFLLPEGLRKGTDVECGNVRSAVDGANKSSGDWVVPYFRLFAKNKDSKKPPLLVHFGGPGTDGSAVLYWASSHRETLASDRDIIGIGQRGTTYSFNLPECPIVKASDSTSFEEYLGQTAEASKACAAAMDRSGIKLLNFSTALAVKDVEAMRIALGFEKVSVYGVSYGTKYFLEYARQFPTSIDRMILDSIVPPNLDFSVYHVDNFSDILRFLSSFEKACNSAASCISAYGGNVPKFGELLESVLAAGTSAYLPQLIVGQYMHSIDLIYLFRLIGMGAVERYIAAAMIVAFANPAGTFTSDGLDTNFHQALLPLRSMGIPVPSDAEIYEHYISLGQPEPGFSPGILSVLNCLEEPVDSGKVDAFLKQESYSDLGPNFKSLLIKMAKIQESTCAGFVTQSNQIMADFSKPVAANTKTYLIQSEFDSATPLEGGKLAASTLPNAVLHVSSCSAHGVFSIPVDFPALLTTKPNWSRDDVKACESQVLGLALDKELSNDDFSCICGNKSK